MNMQEPSDASDGLGLTTPIEGAFVRKASSSASTLWSASAAASVAHGQDIVHNDVPAIP